jgi:hypothetical protein
MYLKIIRYWFYKYLTSHRYKFLKIIYFLYVLTPTLHKQERYVNFSLQVINDGLLFCTMNLATSVVYNWNNITKLNIVCQIQDLYKCIAFYVFRKINNLFYSKL